jgi:hypothetical protein
VTYAPLEGRWLARWIVGTTLANVAGGGAAAMLVVEAHAAGVGHSSAASLPIGVLAGAIAGGVIGQLQAWLMPPTALRRSWLRATVAGTVLVWTLATLMPAIVVESGDHRLLAHIALAMNAGAAAGMLFAAFQTPVVEALGVRTRPWLLGTSAGWGTGTAMTYVLFGMPTSATGAIYAALALTSLGGLASAITTAVTLRLEARRAQLIGQSAGRTCAIELV